MFIHCGGKHCAFLEESFEKEQEPAVVLPPTPEEEPLA